MSINWPNALVAECAERRAVFFLGAGASAACDPVSPGQPRLPDWEKLLSQLRAHVPDVSKAPVLDTLLGERRLLDAAQVIYDNVNPADYNQLINDVFAHHKYKPSKIHELCLEIDPKIVVTTNFDEIYETYCRQGKAAASYKVYKYYDGNPLDGIRSRERVILKAHGCISDPKQIVLTRKQYFEARRNHRRFFDLLSALFLTNTLVFIGYSINDPDISLILEDTTISAPSSFPHYAIVEDVYPPEIEKVIRDTHNIVLLKFPPTKYNEVVDGLTELATQVSKYRHDHP